MRGSLIILLFLTALCSSCKVGELATYGYQCAMEKLWQENGGELPPPPDFLSEEISNSSKDLEKIGAENQERYRESVAETLSAEYGLSEERSYEVSKLMVNWTKLTQSREVTKDDASAFLSNVLGSSYQETVRAIKKAAEGDDSDFNSFIERAAEINEVDPEDMNEILSGIFMN